MDHEEVLDLFEKFEKVAGGLWDVSLDETSVALANIAARICKELTVHMLIEEELFYPPAREIPWMDKVLIDEAVNEHALIKKLIADIKTLLTGLRLDLEITALKKLVEHHVEEEELKLFPLLEEHGMEITELGRKMEVRRLELLGIL